MRDRILKLLKEPSTFAGLAAALGGVGLMGLSEGGWLTIFGAISALAGAIAMLTLDSADAE
jgi:hypothetical protein